MADVVKKYCSAESKEVCPLFFAKLVVSANKNFQTDCRLKILQRGVKISKEDNVGDTMFKCVDQMMCQTAYLFNDILDLLVRQIRLSECFQESRQIRNSLRFGAMSSGDVFQLK